jgi:hypothetical protein
MIKIQDNLAISGIEKSIAQRNLLKKITKIYKDYYIKEPDVKILIPLKDCYIHLRSNIFLFIAFIQSKNFSTFENEVLSTTILTKKLLLEIFDKYYNLLELKLMAEDKIRSTKGNLQLSNVKTDINYEKLKDELTKIVADPIINNNLNKNILDVALSNTTNTTNFIDQLKSFRKSDPLITPIADIPYTTTSQQTNVNTSNNLNLDEIKKYFSSQVKITEPFTNNNSTIGNIFNNSTVGYIYK